MVDPIESSSLLGVLEEAGKRKIPIATLDTHVDSPYVVTLVGVPQREASYTFGQFVSGWITGKLDGQAKVGVMLASTEVQLARRDGFVDALKAVPGAEVVATGDGRNILERATAEAEDMLTAHPEINVIYATGDPQLQGGLAAAAAQGRDIAFFGWDDIPEPFLQAAGGRPDRGLPQAEARGRRRDGGAACCPTIWRASRSRRASPTAPTW